MRSLVAMKRGFVCEKYIQNGKSDEKHLRTRSGVLHSIWAKTLLDDQNKIIQYDELYILLGWDETSYLVHSDEFEQKCKL